MPAVKVSAVGEDAEAIPCLGLECFDKVGNAEGVGAPRERQITNHCLNLARP